MRRNPNKEFACMCLVTSSAFYSHVDTPHHGILKCEFTLSSLADDAYEKRGVTVAEKDGVTVATFG
ncbi:MAG TPA: hypothetical protein VK503_10970 [Candidatus Bathyarchaeia archaeon]|nr:hypothetical protein [Candidatus Bathyarchaeia archaeon]